jgi:hypothetical protein
MYEKIFKAFIAILVIIAVIITGVVLSQYVFNEVNAWLGLISYGVVAVLSVYLIINQIKKHF